MGLVIRGQPSCHRDMLEVGAAHLTEECPLPGMPTACQDGVGILSCIPSGTCNTNLPPQLGSRPPFPAGIEPPGVQGFPKVSLPSHGVHRPSTVPADGEPPARKLLGSTQSWDQLKAQLCPQEQPSSNSRNVVSGCELMVELQGGQSLPEVLLCSRNSICSRCPLLSARARGVGHWGSPVSQVTDAPQKSRACVSARSLVVTATHRACSRARRPLVKLMAPTEEEEEDTPGKRSRVSSASCRTPGRHPAAAQPPGQNKGASNWEKKFGAGSESLP